MTCSSCKYLKENKKREGCVSGTCYFCSKNNCYVNGTNNKCEKYELSYGRSNYICNKIYNEGKKYYDDSTPNSFYLFILIILVILAIVFNVHSS